MASTNYHEEDRDRPVRDSGIPAVPREAPYRAGGKQQGDLSTRKDDLLHTGGVGHVPGRAGSRQLPAMHVEDAHPYTPAPMKPGVLQSGPRPLPREVPVYSTPGHTGAFVRYLDGHTEVHRERPELVDYVNSLHPEDDADERAEVQAEIAHRDSVHLHQWW